MRIPNRETERQETGGGEEEETRPGTSSSNFQPNQLDNDKTSRTSPVVHRSRLPLSVSHPFAPLIHLVQDNLVSLFLFSSRNLGMIIGEEEEKRRKGRKRERERSLGYFLRLVAARYPQPPKERPKIIPGIQKTYSLVVVVVVARVVSPA